MTEEKLNCGHSSPGTTRQIRVFVSSTFRDMQEERDVLIKRIFPQLRKLCEERAVIWTEVDLRWGISTEQAAEGKVLPLCLEEIHRCRPYFIGLLGERYGWVPDPNSIPADLIESQPWLRQHFQHSVTELEILHGVFREEPMHGHAYFYFRDPGYLELVQHEERQGFAAENAEAATKLARLKQKIRAARDEQICELRESYATPEQLGEWILEDFTRLIDRLYPKDQTPDPLDLETARHEAYARNRRLAFVGREDLLHHLSEHSAASGEPLVLTGDSGCGKSALLAEWVARLRKDHPEDLIIQHFIGSTPDSAEWQALVRHILSVFKRAFAITDDIPLQPDALRSALSDWTIKAAGSRRVVLVLDALNQLADSGGAWQLGWLPISFPANFRVFVSTLPGESLNALHKRGWPELNVPLFAREDIVPAALAYFKIFSKTPPREMLVELESTPAACNALYLRAVLDELRQFGKHEELLTKAADYLSAPDLPDLFDRILSRWHDDFGKDPNHPDLVRRTLGLIACARLGLSEAELLDLLGKNGQPLPRRPWTPLYLATENALVLRAGLLNFGHDYLRAAVLKRWLEDANTVRELRLHLAEYFGRTTEPTSRKLDELPTLLRDLENWEALKCLLADIPTFLRLHWDQRWKWELHQFWVSLDQHYEPGHVYHEALDAYETPTTSEMDVEHVLDEIIRFHMEAGDHDSAEPLINRRLEIAETWGTDSLDVADSINSLAQVLQARARFADAERLYRRSLAITERCLGRESVHLATPLHNLGVLLAETGRLPESEPLMRRALAIWERSLGPDHSETARGLSSLSQLLKSSNRLTEAEPLMRRALDIDERRFGRSHPSVARDLNNLAGILMAMNRPAEAEGLYRRALAIEEVIHGSQHPNVARCLSNIAHLLIVANRLSEAEQLIRRAITIDEQTGGEVNHAMASRLTVLTGLLMKTGRQDEAEPLIRRGIDIAERTVGPAHPTTGACVSNLANLLYTTGRAADAEPLYRRVLAIDEERYGSDHLEVAGDLQNLATVLYTDGQFSEIESLLKRAIEILVKSVNESGVQPEALRSVMTFLLACSIKQHIDIQPNQAVGFVLSVFEAQGLRDLGVQILREQGVPL